MQAIYDNVKGKKVHLINKAMVVSYSFCGILFGFWTKIPHTFSESNVTCKKCLAHYATRRRP